MTHPPIAPDAHQPIEIWLLVVAHPDDESMFFIPTLRNLLLRGITNNYDGNIPSQPQSQSSQPTRASKHHYHRKEVDVLCLSNGDYRSESDGPVREKEMHVACSIIGNTNGGDITCNSKFSRGDDNNDDDGRIAVTVLNDEHMKDGPDVVWNSEYVSKVVLDYIQRRVVVGTVSSGTTDNWDYIPKKELKQKQFSSPPPSSTSRSQGTIQSINLHLLTFDEGGVSGHTNHVDVYRGIRCLLHEKCHAVSKEGVDGSKNNNNHATMLRLCRTTSTSTSTSAESINGGIEGDDTIEIFVTVHTLKTISNPLYKYFSWAFVDLFPFLITWLIQMVLYIVYFLLGALPWMEQNKSTTTSTMRQFSGVEMIHRTNTKSTSTMQFRIIDPMLVWRAMAAHHSQFVWYRRLSVIFSRYTYINDLQTMTVNETMSSSADDDDSDGYDDDGDDRIASLLIPAVVVVQEEISSPKFLLTPSQMNVLRESVLPLGLSHRPWKRIYSLLRDGDSFVAFQKQVTDWCKCQGQQSSLLVVKTLSGDIIGGYADVPLVNISSSLSIVGSVGRSCLFKLLTTTTEIADQDPPPIVEVYGKHCTTTSKKIVFDAYRRIIAFGGGEKISGDEGFGLSLEDGFARGTTARCAAFDNEPLVSDQGGVFDVVDVEVWGFVFGQL